MSLFWEARGHRHQGIGGRWFARALAVDHGPSVARARALWPPPTWGSTEANRGHPRPYSRSPGRGGSRWRSAHDCPRRIRLATPGPCSTREKGLAALTKSVELARSIGDEWAVADGLKMMTIAWAVRGDYDGVAGAARELFQVARRLGNKFFLAWSYAKDGITPPSVRAILPRLESSSRRRSPCATRSATRSRGGLPFATSARSTP